MILLLANGREFENGGEVGFEVDLDKSFEADQETEELDSQAVQSENLAKPITEPEPPVRTPEPEIVTGPDVKSAVVNPPGTTPSTETQTETDVDDNGRIFEDGREIIVRIRKLDSFDGDLESEYDGEELKTIIENWISDNTVQGRFNNTDATENMMLFEQVRIPLIDDNGDPLDTQTWAEGLQKSLKDKCTINSKLIMKGLGEAKLVIGEE